MKKTIPAALFVMTFLMTQALASTPKTPSDLILFMKKNLTAAGELKGVTGTLPGDGFTPCFAAVSEDRSGVTIWLQSMSKHQSVHIPNQTHAVVSDSELDHRLATKTVFSPMLSQDFILFTNKDDLLRAIAIVTYEIEDRYGVMLRTRVVNEATVVCKEFWPHD